MTSFFQGQNHAVTSDRQSPCTKFESSVAMVSINDGKKSMNMGSASRLSNTVRVHRKLRDAGVTADLLVFEGMSHAQYLFSVDMPEAKQYFAELSAFFSKYLAK